MIARGPKDLKNDTGLVNSFKDLGWTPPPPKKGICQTENGNSEKNISHLLIYMLSTDIRELILVLIKGLKNPRGFSEGYGG